MDGGLRAVQRRRARGRAPRRGRHPGPVVQQHPGGAGPGVLPALRAARQVRVGRRLGLGARQVGAAGVGGRRRRFRRSRGRLRRRHPARRGCGPGRRHPVRRPGPGRTPRRPRRQRRQGGGLVVRAGRRSRPSRPLPGDAGGPRVGSGAGPPGRARPVRPRGRGGRGGRSRSAATSRPARASAPAVVIDQSRPRRADGSPGRCQAPRRRRRRARRRRG